MECYRQQRSESLPPSGVSSFGIPLISCPVPKLSALLRRQKNRFPVPADEGLVHRKSRTFSLTAVVGCVSALSGGALWKLLLLPTPPEVRSARASKAKPREQTPVSVHLSIPRPHAPRLKTASKKRIIGPLEKKRNGQGQHRSTASCSFHWKKEEGMGNTVVLLHTSSFFYLY
jgi:hypothetical protein